MNLIIANQAINQRNGLYSLNDLHKASGSEKRHQPSNFMANQETKELIKEIESENQIAYDTVVGKGKKQGTYACRELVYRYAMWISPKFSLMVIRAFDALNTGAIPALGSRSKSTTAYERRPLVEAVLKLCRKYKLAHNDVYRMVHQYMNAAHGLEVRHIDEIPYDLLGEAVRYVHTLHLSLHEHGYGSYENAQQFKNDIYHLVWHTMHVYRWYARRSDALYALSPDITVGVHEHIGLARYNAKRLHANLGFDFDVELPRKPRAGG